MIKKKTPQQISRSQLKAKYRNFWTSWRWIPGRSPQVWTDLLNTSMHSRTNACNTLKEALVKLLLEKKITPEQKEELIKMLISQDRESQYLAISIMQSIAPKRFLRKIKYTKANKPKMLEYTWDDVRLVLVPNPQFDKNN